MNILWLTLLLFMTISKVKSELTKSCYSFQPISCDSQSEHQQNIAIIQGLNSSVGSHDHSEIKGEREQSVKCLCNQTQLNNLQKAVQILSESVSKLNLVFSNNPELCYVGVKNGQIPNSAMTASTIASNKFAAYYGRLDRSVGWEYGFWHPAEGHYNGAWLQVDLGKPKRIVGVITQGRPILADQWVTKYKISYANSTTSLINIRSHGQDVVFSGNWNRNNHVKNYFPQPVIARIFRLQAVAYHGVPVVRIEYILC